MKRRAFLKGVGSAAAMSVLASCAHAFRIPLDKMAVPSAGPGADLDLDGLWRDGAAYARWTPSPHNIQPWRLRVVSATEAELYYDHRRLLPVTDPTGAFTIMGLAIFVEYLAIALRQRGHDLHAEFPAKALDFSATRPVLFATMALTSAKGEPAFDRQLILERKTSRLPYDGRVVDAASMQALRAIAAAEGHRLEWSSDRSFVEWTIDLNRFTLFGDLNDAPTRTELRRWIRPTDEEAAAKNDGLWSHCLQFPGWLLKAFFDDHKKWGHGWRARLTGRMLVDGMRGTRTVAWWSGPFETPADWIGTGRVLGRSWLELTRRGFQLHPFGSIVTNAAAHARWTAKVRSREGDSRLWLVARLGRSEAPPRSHRVPASDFFLEASELK